MPIRKILYVFAALTAAATLLALSKAPHPKREQVAGIWVGYTEDDLSLFRLTLLEDGSGYCTSVFVNNPVRLYEVQAWELSGYTLIVDLRPKEDEAEQIWMKGSTTGWKLDLEIGGKELKWKRKLKLYQEAELLSKIELSRNHLPPNEATISK